MRTGPLVRATFLYGVVCFTVLLSWFLLVPRLFPSVFCEPVWSVWKEILHSLACVLAVCGGNIVFTHFYFHEAFSGGLVLRFLWMTFSVSIIPIVLMVLLRQMRLMKAYSQQAEELDQQLPARGAGEDPERTSGAGEGLGPGESSVTGEGSGNLLYAEAADNYVKVFYRGEQQLIRSSLKQLEESFKGNQRIFRCHRAYLVNLDKVVHISGNAQGYKLHLDGVEQPIPVSRSLNGEIARLVTRPKDLPDRPSGL